MILTVTLNAALDHTIHCDRIQMFQKNLAQSEHCWAGGKGINVARLLQQAREDVGCLVVVGGVRGEAIKQDLAAAGLAPTVIQAEGESRTCLELISAPGEATQIHTTGIRASQATLEEIQSVLAKLAPQASWVALCGSLPRGANPNWFAALCKQIRTSGAKLAVDSSGDALRSAWQEAPDLIHVNREELETAFSQPLASFFEKERFPKGCHVAISDGPNSISSWDGSRPGPTLTPPEITLRSSIGCGDALLAGMLLRLEANEGFTQALRWGCAMGSAAAEVPYAGSCDLKRAQQLLNQVEVIPPVSD